MGNGEEKLAEMQQRKSQFESYKMFSNDGGY